MKIFSLLLIVTGFLIHGLIGKEARTWTSSKGSEIEAALVSDDGAKVVLKTAKGRLINLRSNQLSKKDQEYLAQLKSQEKAEDGVITTADPAGWYAQDITGDKVFHSEFLLKAGKSREFEVPAKGKKQAFVGFSAKEGLEINKTYKKKKPYAIELKSHSDSTETLSSNIGGGMDWNVKSGKVRFTIKNHGEQDTRILITTKK